MREGAVSELDEAGREFADAAHELAQAIGELWRCECGKWTRLRPCPDCGHDEPETTL